MRVRRKEEIPELPETTERPRPLPITQTNRQLGGVERREHARSAVAPPRRPRRQHHQLAADVAAGDAAPGQPRRPAVDQRDAAADDLAVALRQGEQGGGARGEQHARERGSGAVRHADVPVGRRDVREDAEEHAGGPPVPDELPGAGLGRVRLPGRQGGLAGERVDGVGRGGRGPERPRVGRHGAVEGQAQKIDVRVTVD